MYYTMYCILYTAKTIYTNIHARINYTISLTEELPFNPKSESTPPRISFLSNSKAGDIKTESIQAH